MIGEAKRAGADYVLTPEMTNIMEVKRERLFATHRGGGERRQPRGVPRTGAQVLDLPPCRLARHQGVARQGGQPLVPDRSARARSSRATTRFTCSTSISKTARAIANRAITVPGELAVVADLPWGRHRPHRLLRSALPRALSRAGRSRRLVPHRAFGLHQADRRGALARAAARARDREQLLRVRGRARRQARERPRDLRPFAGHRSVGPHPGRRRHRARRGHGRDRSGARSRRRARGFRRCSMAGASNWSSRWRSLRTCMRSEARRDPLHARLRPAAHVRELVPEFRRLRQAAQARAGDVPGLRLRQGREGDHGAASRRAPMRRKPSDGPGAGRARRRPSQPRRRSR